MSIRTVCIGKLKEGYFKDRVVEYVKRMGRFVKIKIVQVPNGKASEKLSPTEMEQVKEIEGKRILDKIKDREYVYMMTVKGKERTSEDLAKELTDLTIYEHSDITPVTRRSLGTSDAVNKQADGLVSFSKFIMPRQLMYLALVEQIYHVLVINNGSSYHK